jgi:hypothetical protein
MHKFHLGQLVEFNPPRGIYAPRGPYVVIAKLPGLARRRVRISCSECQRQHDRAVLENELRAISIEDEVTTDAKSKRLTTGESKAKPTTVKQKR